MGHDSTLTLPHCHTQLDATTAGHLNELELWLSVIFMKSNKEMGTAQLVPLPSLFMHSSCDLLGAVRSLCQSLFVHKGRTVPAQGRQLHWPQLSVGRRSAPGVAHASPWSWTPSGYTTELHRRCSWPHTLSCSLLLWRPHHASYGSASMVNGDLLRVFHSSVGSR